MKRILVVGAGGYIGSHMVKLLLARGFDVLCLDNFSTGYRDAIVGGTILEVDLADAQAISLALRAGPIDAVMHFASYIQVGESVRDPAKYYLNNVANTLNLLAAMVSHGVDRFVFSSSAAVFGVPERTPIDEDHPRRPINPYGRSKLMVEEILQDFDAAFGLRSISLRYFNAAGADPDGQLGERHDPETHLIPLVLQAASGRRPAISVFGDDYDTPDGTCIRDYIHIVDLCEAHLRAIEALDAGHPTGAYNLGNGAGFSVKEVIGTAERVTGKAIAVNVEPRRPGDPARLVADASRARAKLGWTPRYPDLGTIIAHAWAWEKQRG